MEIWQFLKRLLNQSFDELELQRDPQSIIDENREMIILLLEQRQKISGYRPHTEEIIYETDEEQAQSESTNPLNRINFEADYESFVECVKNEKKLELDQWVHLMEIVNQY